MSMSSHVHLDYAENQVYTMPSEDPIPERVTLTLVYGELENMRSEFNGGLASLRNKMDEQGDKFVSKEQFDERGKRFEGDFLQVTADVALAKKTADASVDRVNSRIDKMNLLAIAQLATLVGGIIYIVVQNSMH